MRPTRILGYIEVREKQPVPVSRFATGRISIGEENYQWETLLFQSRVL
jgi:hypothetical protein